MARISKTTRDASGAEFQVDFEDNGNPNGPLMPLAQIDGTVIVDLAPGAEVVASFDGELPAGSQTIGGVEIRNTPAVVDGSARIVRVPRHVTSTGSAVQAAAANPNRVYLDLFNSSDTDQWYRFDGTAAVGGAGSIQLRPGDRDIYDGARVTPTGAISVICGTPGKVLSVWEA